MESICNRHNVSSLTSQQEMVYSFAHHKDSLNGVLSTLAGKKEEVYVLGNAKESSGVLSCSDTQELYRTHSIRTKAIPFEDDVGSINTRNESEAVIQWAVDNGVQKLYIISPSYHIVRAYMTILSVCMDKNIRLNIVPISDIMSSSQETLITHQGKTKTSWCKILDMEMERIREYTSKKDIRSAEEVWWYMDSLC